MEETSYETSYVIKAKVPIRAFVIAALASVIGAGGLVLVLSNQWAIGWAIAAGAVLAFGVVLALLGLIAMKRLSVRLTLTDEGYELVGPRGEQAGYWEDVTRVSLAQQRRLLTIYEGEQIRHQLVFNLVDEQQLEEILEDLSQRLDYANGYTNL